MRRAVLCCVMGASGELQSVRKRPDRCACLFNEFRSNINVLFVSIWASGASLRYCILLIIDGRDSLFFRVQAPYSCKGRLKKCLIPICISCQGRCRSRGLAAAFAPDCSPSLFFLSSHVQVSWPTSPCGSSVASLTWALLHGGATVSQRLARSSTTCSSAGAMRLRTSFPVSRQSGSRCSRTRWVECVDAVLLSWILPAQHLY